MRNMRAGALEELGRPYSQGININQDWLTAAAYVIQGLGNDI